MSLTAKNSDDKLAYLKEQIKGAALEFPKGFPNGGVISGTLPNALFPPEIKIKSQEDHYATLPKSVRVGAYDFRIEVSEMGDSVANGEFGHTNLLMQKIRLAPNQTGQCLANTAMHECFHAIHWVYGLIDENVDEECFTTLGTNGFCAFVQDNPAFMTWFMNANRRAP